MNPQINKVTNDIQKTKDKIAELQALLPTLEKKKTDLENAEIVKLVRKASVEPGKLAGFLESIKPTPVHATQEPTGSGQPMGTSSTPAPPVQADISASMGLSPSLETDTSIDSEEDSDVDSYDPTYNPAAIRNTTHENS